eukprot:CAMPEP_0179011636 /NCGR_PEP_ID=MMETSP0796-20121207/771_1 /TAXON_ID=73915 /ORGANISM="Pyrodinium bahamense, Strain pbaha01" /LENGTH=380 /DNA_ID=CAMNT_0020707031 /DNA_START=193 /DNA_END=1337 /DNA_ORIENTATION=-
MTEARAGRKTRPSRSGARAFGISSVERPPDAADTSNSIQLAACTVTLERKSTTTICAISRYAAAQFLSVALKRSSVSGLKVPKQVLVDAFDEISPTLCARSLTCALEKVNEVRVAEVVAPLQKVCATGTDLFFPPLPQLPVELWTGVNFECEGVRRLQLVIHPVQASTRTGVTHLLPGSPVGALAMVLVNTLQDLQHCALIPASNVRRVIRPRHVEATRATVHCKERGWLVLRDELPEQTSLRLAEWVRSGICADNLPSSASVPLLIPVSVEVNTVRVRTHAKVATLDDPPGPWVSVQDHLKLAILEDISGRRPAIGNGLPAEHLQEVQAALRADQLSAVLTEDDENAVHRPAAGGPHTNHVDRHIRVGDRAQRQRPAAI